MSLSDRGLTVNGSSVEEECTIVEHKEVSTGDPNMFAKSLIELDLSSPTTA